MKIKQCRECQTEFMGTVELLCAKCFRQLLIKSRVMMKQIQVLLEEGLGL